MATTSRFSVLLLGLSFSLVTGQDADFEVSIPSGDTQVRAAGDSLFLKCLASGVDSSVDPNLKWFDKEGREILQESSRVYVESDGLFTLNLYIVGIQDSNAGTYVCRGEVNGQTEEATSTLSVFKDITFDHAPSPQYKAIYTDALIECQVSGNPAPTVSWRYNSRNIQPGGRYIVSEKGLTILNITADDDDFVYRCIGQVLEDGRYDSRQIYIEVRNSPRFQRGQETEISLAPDTTVNVTCRTEGEPTATITWIKDGVEISDNGTYRLYVTDEYSTSLQIASTEQVAEWIYGDYTCRADNGVVPTAELVFHVTRAANPDPDNTTNMTNGETNSASSTLVTSSGVLDVTLMLAVVDIMIFWLKGCHLVI